MNFIFAALLFFFTIPAFADETPYCNQTNICGNYMGFSQQRFYNNEFEKVSEMIGISPSSMAPNEVWLDIATLDSEGEHIKRQYLLSFDRENLETFYIGWRDYEGSGVCRFGVCTYQLKSEDDKVTIQGTLIFDIDEKGSKKLAHRERTLDSLGRERLFLFGTLDLVR